MNLPEQIAVGTTTENFAASPAVQMLSIAATIPESDIEELFASCMPRLAKTARRLMRNTEDSEDLLQETMLSAFKNLHQFEGRSKFSTWLHSIVRNKAKMHLRKAGAHRCCSLEDVTNEHGELLLDVAPAVDPDAEATCLGNERSEILRRVLLRLSPGHRLVIQLCDIEGLEGKAAAARLGLTLSGLKTRLHRARKSVTRKLADTLAQEHPKTRDMARCLRGEAETLAQPAPAMNAIVSITSPSAVQRRDEKVTPAPTSRSSFAAAENRRAVGVHHERPKRIRQYYGLPVECRHSACNASGAV